MILLLALLVFLVAGTLIAIGIQHDQGYVMLEYQDWVIETNVAVLLVLTLIVFFVLYYLLRLLTATRKVPEKFTRYKTRRQLRQSQQALTKSTALMLEGKWSAAESQAVRLLQHSQTPLLHNLLAARAAFHQGATERCKKYLTQAAASKEKNAVFSADITHAELFLESEQPAQALPILRRLRIAQGNKPLILNLFKQAYLQEEDWERLLETLKDLHKKDAIDILEKEQLEQKAYARLLLAASEEDTSKAIRTLWKRMPDAIKDTEVMAFQYISYLLDYGEEKEAAATLKACLKRSWQPRLLSLFQRFKNDYSSHLRTLEGWLQLHGEDAFLLRTTGKIALSAGLWETAKQHLERSLSIESHADSYRALGLAMEQLQQPEEAAQCFRKGLLLPIEKELALPKTSP